MVELTKSVLDMHYFQSSKNPLLSSMSREGLADNAVV